MWFCQNTSYSRRPWNPRALGIILLYTAFFYSAILDRTTTTRQVMVASAAVRLLTDGPRRKLPRPILMMMVMMIMMMTMMMMMMMMMRVRWRWSKV